MSTKIFVNLPVKDLDRSKHFFAQLGYTFNPQFTDDKAACMVISEDIYAMLLKEEFFLTFTDKKIADSSKYIETMTCLSADSKQAVEDVIGKAIKAGGTTYRAPQDYGTMYGHGFQDLDGHIWEYMWMDPAMIQQPETAAAGAAT